MLDPGLPRKSQRKVQTRTLLIRVKRFGTGSPGTETLQALLHGAFSF